ncbi:DUF4333 domain-containing protein [Hoyosella sp. G463]|uniref:DUF4333 domain-containing protein n=1 Tax=Lolliginicoccus lacisalsi TaxID=2742202 RepID=A0A927J9V3_9ACTN|nr:DUF4333 domain-containing protein [Lolliginicoccus lacisalsi]MBD8505358.1 DUF4333 domain-containing protein [Lolliginicoccus lacisalsi]
MTRSRIATTRVAAGLASLVALGALTACSGSLSIGGKVVDQEEVASQISAELATQVGREPELVECPDDLDAEVGATLTCTLTDDGDLYDVLVEVTEVNGDDVLFDFEVEQRPS